MLKLFLCVCVAALQVLTAVTAPEYAWKKKWNWRLDSQQELRHEEAL
jgi:hypothetical protein